MRAGNRNEEHRDKTDVQGQELQMTMVKTDRI